MKNINSNGLKRVTKPTAKRLFRNGTTLYIYASNVRPYNSWVSPFEITFDSDGATFDSLVNTFEYYNCSHSELGKYASFYIQEVENV